MTLEARCGIAGCVLLFLAIAYAQPIIMYTGLVWLVMIILAFMLLGKAVL